MNKKNDFSRDELFEDLLMYYEAAGFDSDVLDDLSDEELLRLYEETFEE